MADADEDVIPRSQPSGISASTDPTADPEDEAQDFRFLASLTASKSTGASAIPKRGEKDFEPNPTQAQSNTLAASREAMHNALSVERVLPPQNPLVGQFLPDARDWRWDVMPTEEEEGGKGKGGRCVVVEKFRTTYAKSIGVSDYRNWAWLLPEEALFLIERGTLDIRWPDEKVRAFMKGGTAQDGGSHDESGSDEDDAESQDNDSIRGEDSHEGDVTVKGASLSAKRKHPHQAVLQVGEVPMSLQGAYASFIGKSGLTLERYNVYAGLRRLGYIVQRAPTWDDTEDDNRIEQHTNGHAAEPNGHVTTPLLATTSPPLPQPSTTSSNPATSLINRLVSYLFTPKPLHYQPSHGPLIYPGLYRNYNDIFRALTIIPHHNNNNSATAQRHNQTPKPPFSISWHVHKPSPNTKFRKSAPPPPDFRISVIDARTSTVPTAAQIGSLLDSMPEDRLSKDKKMETRLKHGVSNVILAVVDCGLVSYLRLADMCSGSEGRVADTKASRGGKRGGGWRRGGAAAGRGRGGKR